MGSLFRILILLVAFAAFGRAQTSAVAALEAFPSCALPCVLTAVEASPCNLTDTECQCTNAELVGSATLCITGSCTVEDALVAENVTQTMCGAPIRDMTTESNVIYITMISIAFVVVVIRLVYKQSTSTHLELDDWFILSTIIIGVPSSVVNVAGLSAHGLGRDIWTLSPDMITQFAMSFYIVSILYVVEVFLLKLSILFFYIKIFPGRTIQRLLWGTVVFNTLFGIAFTLVVLFQCAPISYNWTSWKGEGGGTCVDINIVAWANAGVSIALDLWMLALPLSQLRNLKMHWKKKVGVALMFCVGTFVTVVSAIRLISLVQFRASSNLSWDYWSVSVWSSVEITVGIICACMPSMRVILVRAAPRIFSNSSRMLRSSYYRNGDSMSRKSNGPGQSNRLQKRASSKQNLNRKSVYDSRDQSVPDSPEVPLFPEGTFDIVGDKSVYSEPLQDLKRPQRVGSQIIVSTQYSVRTYEQSAASPLEKHSVDNRWP